jgi:Ca-activated chloride channel family protein
MMNKAFYISLYLIVYTVLVNAQAEKVLLSNGNTEYQEGNFEAAAELYNQSIAESPDFEQAAFNLGDAMFRQEKYEEAINQFQSLSRNASTDELKSKAFHNLGNSLMQTKKLEESVEAYKQSLRLNSTDEDTRYNLSVAQKMLQKQEQQEQEQEENQDENKDDENKENQEKEDNKEGDEEDQEKKDQEQKDKKPGDDGEEKPQPQQGEPKNKISKEDANRLLEALQNQEKNTQEKLKLERLEKGKSIGIEKKW